jgi:hypothetical protein
MNDKVAITACYAECFAAALVYGFQEERHFRQVRLNLMNPSSFSSATGPPPE